MPTNLLVAGDAAFQDSPVTHPATDAPVGNCDTFGFPGYHPGKPIQSESLLFDQSHFSGLKHASELNAVQVHSGGQVPGREGQREGTRTREKSIPLIYQPTRRIKYLHLNPTSFRQGEAHAG